MFSVLYIVCAVLKVDIIWASGFQTQEVADYFVILVLPSVLPYTETNMTSLENCAKLWESIICSS